MGGFSQLGARKYCFTVAAIVIDLDLPTYVSIIYLLEFAIGFSRLGAHGQGYEQYRRCS